MNNPKIKIVSQPQVAQNNNKIKIVQDPNIDMTRASHFEELLSKAQMDIVTNENLYNLFPVQKGDSVIYQYWKFEFPGKNNFQGKCISGVLQFQSNHPVDAPRFIFDAVRQGQQQDTLQHENIYGDGSLCIPLFTYWKQTTSEFEILQAIEDIFHRPNWSENDAPANPVFSNLSEKEKAQKQREQAQFLENFTHKK